MHSILDKLADKWPLSIHNRSRSFPSLRQEMEDFLDTRGIGPRRFSHFGVVVGDIDESVTSLTKITGQEMKIAKRTWFEDYKVHVAKLEGLDLEFVQPDGDSFILESLQKHGENLQHMSYLVDDVAIFDECIARLRESGAEIVDERDHKSGKIGFARTTKFGPIILEFGVAHE